MPQPSPQAPIHPENLRDDRERWYMTLPDDEAEIAMAWLEKHDPQAIEEQRVTDVLHLQQLRPTSEVVLLLRKPKTRGKLTPTQGYEVAQMTGERVTVRKDPAELIGEMQAYGPLPCEPYWVKGLTRFSSQLNRQKFLEELGALAAPVAAPRFADVASKKNGDMPELLQLRSV
jgi:hypothetical protein